MNIVRRWVNVKSDVNTRRESVASLARNIAADIKSECGQDINLGEYLRTTLGYAVLISGGYRNPSKYLPTPIGFGESNEHWTEPLGYYEMFVDKCDEWLAKDDSIIRAELELLLSQRA